MRKLVPLFLFLLFAGTAHASCTGSSPTWTTTADQSSVQTCINNATAGDTINISATAGTVSWTSVTLAKNVTLVGAGQGTTVGSDTQQTGGATQDCTASGTCIDVSGGNPAFHVSKQTSGTIRIKNLAFITNSNNTLPHCIQVTGAWPNSGAVVFENDTFTNNSGTVFDVNVAGGVLFTHDTFNGNWNDFFGAFKDLSNTNSWTTADSLGTNDTTGLMNTYIEDSTFNGGSNGVFDCDDNTRLVVRHNTFNESGGFNSHGWDSSPYGCREFEIYNNSFNFPDKNCNGGLGNSSLSNINQYIWIRGGTGIVQDNTLVDLTSSCWGNKSEVRLSIRGAEDDRPQGTCAATHYPVPHQVGQNNNGTADFTDPIYFSGNTGTGTVVGAGWTDFGGGANPCGFDWNTFFGWGRDAINTTVGTVTLSSNGGTVALPGGTAKPGYTHFTYPHPLATVSGPVISFNPTPSVNFSNVNVGSTSGAMTLTINNVGTSNEVLSTPYFTLDDTTHYAVTGGTCSNGGTIAAGGSCTSTLTCSPTANGAVNSTMHVLGTVNADESLTCNGVTPSVPPSSSGVIISTTNPPSTSTWTVNIKDCSLCTLKITCVSGCKRNAQLTFSLQ